MYRIAIALSLVFLPLVSGASPISSVSRFAWGEGAGWVNFSPSNGSVEVTDSGMTGYAWSATLGWINLSPSNGGVANDGKGDLSGFAWGEQTGWIDFDGVSIDSSGVFSGEATSPLVGTINFSCANCLVTTSWRRVGQDASSSGSRSGTSRRNFLGGLSTYLASIWGGSANDQVGEGAVEGGASLPLDDGTSPVREFSSVDVSASVTSTTSVSRIPSVDDQPSSLAPTSVSAPITPAVAQQETKTSLISRAFRAVKGFFSAAWNVFVGLF